MTTEKKKPHSLEHGKQKLSNMHSITLCAGHTCSVHNRSDHAMRSFPQHWRADRCIMERMCPHGVGHDDPDCLTARERLGREHSGIHGCCGCCVQAQTLLDDGVPSEQIYSYITDREQAKADAVQNEGLVPYVDA